MRFYCTSTGPIGGLNCEVLLYAVVPICVCTYIYVCTYIHIIVLCSNTIILLYEHTYVIHTHFIYNDTHIYNVLPQYMD